MPVVVKIIGGGSTGTVRTPYDGQYVAGEYTPGTSDGPGEPHFGDLPTVWDIDKARRFDTATAAMEWWRQEHPNGVGGYRTDGKPNRPLTFFTVQIDPVFA